MLHLLRLRIVFYPSRRKTVVPKRTRDLGSMNDGCSLTHPPSLTHSLTHALPLTLFFFLFYVILLYSFFSPRAHSKAHVQ